MEKWFVINKGADFEKLGKEFGISPVTARLIRNREVIGEAAFESLVSSRETRSFLKKKSNLRNKADFAEKFFLTAALV